MSSLKQTKTRDSGIARIEKPAIIPSECDPRETVEVPSGYFPVTAEEKAMNRAFNVKLDIFLLPFLSLLYLFNGLDRGNVGNAQTQGCSLLLSGIS